MESEIEDVMARAAAINEAAEAIRSDRYYVLVCRICDPPLPMPFLTPEDRGRWASEHTKGTGHDSWLVVDP